MWYLVVFRQNTKVCLYRLLPFAYLCDKWGFIHYRKGHCQNWEGLTGHVAPFLWCTQMIFADKIPVHLLRQVFLVIDNNGELCLCCDFLLSSDILNQIRTKSKRIKLVEITYSCNSIFRQKQRASLNNVTISHTVTTSNPFTFGQWLWLIFAMKI